MFEDIKLKIRGWLTRMGLIEELKKLETHRKINLDSSHYERVNYWNNLYTGYPDEGSYSEHYTVMNKSNDRRLLTLNLPKQISQEMATIVFNENVEFTVDGAFGDTFDTILKENHFYRNMQQKYEQGLALGGMVIKPYIKDDEIKFSYVSASNFYPLSWDNGRVKEAVFPHRFKRDKYYYTHLEWHEWEDNRYRIKNTLHRSNDANKIGVEVPLSYAFDELEPVIYFDGLEQDNLFIYIKPNTGNNFDSESPLGVSIYANAIDTIETIDRMFDSLNREFRLGKQRIFVPENMVNTVVDKQTGAVNRYFDAEDEVYEAFTGNMDDSKIQGSTIELRVEEHVQAIDTMLKVLASQVGFSPNAFSFDSSGMKTATEVVSENSKTFKTKQSHEVILEQALIELVDITAYLTETFSLGSVGEYEVAVHFDDSIAEDKAAEMERIRELVASRLMPRIKAIEKLHGLTEEEAKEWFEIINKESQTINGLDVGLFADE